MPDRLANKVLLVGWDAADWNILRPLLARGWMPNLQKFIDEGASGNLASLRPMLSPMLWTSIATGKRPHKHGIHGFVEPRPQGDGIRAVASTSRTTKALWNILTQNALRTHCVNWYASHPAEPINGVCVSNRFAVAPPAPARPWPIPEGTIHPPELREVFKQLRVRPEEMDASTLLPFVPAGAKVDQAHDKRVLAIAIILAETATTHGAITWCLEHRPWDFAAVLYNAIDQFCHLFMQYHRPRRDSVSAEDFELYHDVVTTAYRFHDMMLGRLMQLAGDDAAMLIVSDHGYRAAPPSHQPRDIPRSLEALSLEHRPHGICLMRGPHITAGTIIQGASLLDVTPTILTLLGLPIGADMDGRPWLEALDPPPRPDTILSWDQVPGDAGQHPPDAAESPADSLEAVRHLIDLGYVEPPDEDAQLAIDRTLADNQFNLARALIDARQPTRAIPLLEKLIERHPAHPGYHATLFEAFQAVGRIEDCRRIASAMWDHGYRGPLVNLAMAVIDIAQRRADSALAHLREAERVNPDLPGVHVLAGRAYIRLHQWPEADQSFDKALRLDPDNESAWDGKAQAALGRHEYERAAEHALQSVSLRSDYPEAHYHLGVALLRIHRPHDAEIVFKRALSLRPNLLAACGHLIDLYAGPLLDPTQERRYRGLAQEIILRRRLHKRPHPAPAASAPASERPSRPTAH